MRSTQDAQNPKDDAYETRRSFCAGPIDRLEMLVAAAEAGDLGQMWIADPVAESGRVSR